MLLQQIKDLIAAVQAQQYMVAFALAMAIAQAIIADLNRQGVRAHQAVAAHPQTSGDLTSLCQQLDAASQGSINWQNLLAIILAIGKALLPLIIGG